MRMIPAGFARVSERCTSHLCMDFLPIFQQLGVISKTCNQLSVSFGEITLSLRDTVVLAALDTLASTGVAVMMRCAVVHEPVCLPRGGLAPWTDSSDAHGVLWTSTGGDRG